MRLLVLCPHCRRQFDASGREVGSFFPCPCGTMVEVRQPESHEASVVRCASCGAPRLEGARQCSFCGSDFTLREQDLDTVCPNCLARVSDQAQFCHHCGTSLVPEEVIGEATTLECPACRQQRTLTSRRMGSVAVLECGRCAGLWIGSQTFRHLTEQVAREAENQDEHFARHWDASAGARPSEPARYRPCVVCHQLMNRRNYGYASGAIVDYCKDHGIWFDADELPRILEFIRAGGLAQTRGLPAADQPADGLEPTARDTSSSEIPLLYQPQGIVEKVVKWLAENFRIE